MRELSPLQNTEQTIISATNKNPYRKGLVVKNEYVVDYKGGAGKDRLAVGGVELGQFFSSTDLNTGKAQAYTYYIGEGSSFSDVAKGKAKFSFFNNPKLLVETKAKVSPYSEGLFNVASKRNYGVNPVDLPILQKFSQAENIAGTNRVGFAGSRWLS